MDILLFSVYCIGHFWIIEVELVNKVFGLDYQVSTCV
jgi:hypothetical protein